MTEVIDINDALRLYLPKTIELPPDVTLSNFKWHLHDRLPTPETRTYPYGTIELLNTSPRFNGRKPARQATKVLVQQVDTPTFVTGTLSYELTRYDTETIVSVTGTMAAAPHTFVQGTDYELADDDAHITWLGADEPDNGTVFTVTYQHRMYRRHFGMDGSITVRLHVVAKEYEGPTRNYDKSQMGWLLALSVEQFLRLNAGRVMSKPPANASTPYHLEAAAGDFLSSSKEFVDPSEGVEAWSLDFRVNASYIVRKPQVEAILTLGITPEIIP